MARLRSFALSFLILFFSALTANASAHESSRPEIFSYEQQYKNENDQWVVQRNTIYFTTQDNLNEALSFAEADLYAEGFSHETSPSFAIASLENRELFNNASSRFQPKTLITVEASDFAPSPTQKGRVPSSEISEQAFSALEAEFNEYYSKNFKTRRISLIVSRFTVNGAVSSFGFIAAGLPWSHAIVLGSLTGALSGTIQILSRPLNDFLSTNKYGIALAKKLGFQVTEKVEKSNFFTMLLKWGGVEVTFLSLLKLAAFSLGDLASSATLSTETLSVFMTASKSLVSQGLWDTSVAKEISPRVRAAILEHDFIKASRLRFRSEISGFAGSMIWSAAAITDMMGVPIGNFVFGGLAAAGGGNHVRLLVKDKSRKFEQNFKFLSVWCDSLLKAKK